MKISQTKMPGFLTLLALLILPGILTYGQVTRQTAKNADGKWNIRYSQSSTQEKISLSTAPDGFSIVAPNAIPEAKELFAFIQLKLDKPIVGLSFKFSPAQNESQLPITLFDAAANELWNSDVPANASGVVVLKDIKVRGQLVFRIGAKQSKELPKGWSLAVSNIKLTVDRQLPVINKDGYTLIDNTTELRGYACEDNVKVRLKPGNYQIEKAFGKQFIEFTGNHSLFDLKGVRFMVNTKLFSQTAVAQGIDDANLYCVMGLIGNHITMNGIYLETYGNQPGIQSRNKIFNIVGSNVTLKDAEVRTEGSNPWGFGSLYGIFGDNVRKMNGIRVGYPAKDVKLIGCKVHMRAMGHAIFVQGAENTWIEDCHVDGLLRTTNDILSETSGFAFNKNFIAAKGGYVEGVVVAEDGKILPGEMISLSEDGIRMYPQAQSGDETKTGHTTIINCTVTNMRRGICTGLSAASDKIINCQVTNCVAAGFNLGANDTLINSRADAKYAEAICLPYTASKNANVEVEILDSRGGTMNNPLAVINGKGHNVIIKTSDPSFIPDYLKIELSSRNGYANYQRSTLTATEIQLTNKTPASVLLLPGTLNPKVQSVGKVEDRTGTK